jgi:hypothetical protein
MEILDRVTKRYFDLDRRYLSLNQKSGFNYARNFPVVDMAMRNLSHPVFGPTLRRLFRFEDPGRHTPTHIVPIHQQIRHDELRQNAIMLVENLRRVIEDSSYRMRMEETVPIKDNLVDHFWGSGQTFGDRPPA